MNMTRRNAQSIRDELQRSGITIENLLFEKGIGCKVASMRAIREDGLPTRITIRSAKGKVSYDCISMWKDVVGKAIGKVMGE